MESNKSDETGPVLEHSEPARLRERTARDIELDQILARAHALPVIDPRTPDEIIGYNELGLFD